MCLPHGIEQSGSELFRWGASIVVPAAAGLVGVMIGAWLTARRERRQRQLAFIEKQLSLFYSPLLGLRNGLLADGKLRVRIQSSAEQAWRAISTDTKLSPEALRRVTAERWPEFDSLISYDNQQLRERHLPTYHKMLKIFSDNYGLAEPATREYYTALLEFTSIWDRWLAKALPREVLIELDHGEASLEAFYAHITSMHDALRAKLKAGGGDD